MKASRVQGSPYVLVLDFKNIQMICKSRYGLEKGKEPIKTNNDGGITVFNEEKETLFTLPCISYEAGS